MNPQHPFKTFTYLDQLYIRVIPTKRLFNSTTVHEIVNRGDIFAVRVSDSVLTVIPGTAKVTHHEHSLCELPAQRSLFGDNS